MSAIIVLLIIVTILQVVICHFSLWWLIALICRVLFSTRIIGVTFKVKKLAITEGVVFGVMLIFNMLFSKDSMPWLNIFLYLIFSLVAIGLEYLDDILYVYVIEDEEED